MKIYKLILLLLIVFPSFISAQYFKINAPADWVIPINSKVESTYSKYDISGGAYYAVNDIQNNIVEKTSYSHFVLNIVTSAGISSASEVYISYDTTYQKVDFHYLYVWRNGKKIDRTNDLTFEELQNENNLQSGIYTGVITAYEILEDLRVDDKIEFAYSIIGVNPIFDNYHFEYQPLVTNNPYDYYSHRLIYPKDEKYYFECNNCESQEIKEATIGDLKSYTIILKDQDAFDTELNFSFAYMPYPYFCFTNSDNWHDIAVWASSVFDVKEEQNLDSVFEEIFTGNETTEDKINAIIDYVQNDIRYMGIESGIGSIKPFSPEQVVKQRYGDCKDKSLLLQYLLREIGVEKCCPALVNSGLRRGITNLPVGAQIFDHCIFNFEYENEVYWIDPTITQQGSDFKHKQIPDYGLALLIDEKSKKLTKLELHNQIYKTENYETYNISSFDEPGELIVINKLYGEAADNFRAVMEYYSIKNVSENMKNIYSSVYSNITIKERLTIDDDIDQNIMTLVMSYNMNNIWTIDEQQTKIYKFIYEPLELYSIFSALDCAPKKHPIDLSHLVEFNQMTTFNLPDRILMKDGTMTEDNDAFFFSKSEKYTKSQMIMEYNYKSKVDEVAPDLFDEICPVINGVMNNIQITLSYPYEYYKK